MNQSMSLFMLVLLGVGELLGGGIYSILSEAAPLSGTLTWLSFLVSAFLALLTVLSVAALSSLRPDCSGIPGCIRDSTGSGFLGFLSGTCQVAAYMMGLSATAVIFTKNSLVDSLVVECGLPQELAVVVFLLVMEFINCNNVEFTAISAGVCTLVEASGVLIVIVAGIWFLCTGQGGSTEHVFWDPIITSHSFMRSIPLTFFAFGGITSLYAAVEEAAEPHQVAPAMVLQLVVVTILYVAVAIAVACVLGPNLHQSQEALLDTVTLAIPGFPSSAFSLIKLFAGFNTSLGIHYALSRMVMAMARSHELPNWFAHVDVGSGTPKRASSLVTAVAAAVAICTNVFEVISSATLFLLVLYTLGSASLCISQSKGEVGRFNVPVLVPYAAVFTNASFLVYYLMFEFDSIKFVMGVILASTLWYSAVGPL